MFSFLKNDRGFTLIELLVVVAIIAILAAVAIPALMNYTQNARESRVLGDLASYKTVVEAYAATDGKGHYPGNDEVEGIMDKAAIDWPPEDPRGESFSYAVDDSGRNYAIWTVCEPEDDFILVVTNGTDPAKIEPGDLEEPFSDLVE